MVSTSELYSIMTNIPVFDQQEYDEAEKILKSKIGEGYHIDNLPTYMKTRGIITVAKDFNTQIEKKVLFDEDPLPDGAKSYLQQKWLNNNYSLYPYSKFKTENVFSLKKGNIQENYGIEILNTYLKRNFEKNTIRKNKNFLTGECDIDDKDFDQIIDIKIPENWESFRGKVSLSLQYFFQVIGYCYLYNRSKGSVAYILTETPIELIEEYSKYLSQISYDRFLKTEESLKKLDINKRVKIFNITEEDVQSYMPIVERRLSKSKEYYDGLTYEECMNMLE